MTCVVHLRVGRSSGGGSPLWRGGSAGGWDYCMPMVRLPCAPGAVMTCTHAHTTLTVVQVLCQFLLRARRGRVMSCCGWQAQQGIGTARPPASLRQEAEVGGAAPGAGEGGWCEKTTKNLVKGVGMYAARCARHVSVARASTPCYFSCRLAVRVPREEHTVRRFSRGGLSFPVCRRCGCGISYLLTYLHEPTAEPCDSP